MKVDLVLFTVLCTTILHTTKCESDSDEEDQQLAYVIAQLSQSSLEKFWTVVGSLNITVGAVF